MVRRGWVDGRYEGERAVRHIGVLIVALASLALSACDDGVSALVPASIEQSMAWEFPADGKIHVHYKGVITIKPETEVCDIQSAVPESSRSKYFGINSDTLFEPLGQSSNSKGGGDRQVAANDSWCKKPGSVFIYGRKSDYSTGSPYKLVLAVWQGDPDHGGAYWIGGLERLDGHRPEITDFPPYRVGPEALAKVSTIVDIRELSEAFVDHVRKVDMK